MAQSHSVSQSGCSSPRPAAKRKLVKLADVEKEDRNPETAGAALLSLSETGRRVRSKVGASTKEKDKGKDADGDALMDEKDQIELDERLAKELHDSEVKEQNARVEREQKSQALRERMRQRSLSQSRPTNGHTSPPETKRFIAAVQVTQCEAKELWALVTQADITVYGYKPMPKPDHFEVIYIENKQLAGMIEQKDKYTPDARLHPVSVAERASQTTTTLIHADAVIGELTSNGKTKTVSADVVLSPLSAAATAISPAGPLGSAPEPPDAPQSVSRQLFLGSTGAKTKPPEGPPAEPSTPRKPPTMGRRVVAPPPAPRKKTRRRIIEDVDENADPAIEIDPDEVMKSDWSLNDDHPQVSEVVPDTPPLTQISIADRLFGKQVDRYAREEAAAPPAARPQPAKEKGEAKKKG